MNPNNIFYYFSMLVAHLWLPPHFVHFFFSALCLGKEWNTKSWTHLQSTSKPLSVFYFFLSSVSVFYLRSWWILSTGFDLIFPIILAYMHSQSNDKDNVYASFSLWTYYKHLAEFKWSWRYLLICYQHLFTNNILSQSLEKVMFHGNVFQSQPAMLAKAYAIVMLW